MNRPEILGCEVLTPDGRGSILSLHKGRVVVLIHKTEKDQIMKGGKRGPGAMHYSYDYEDVEIIKGQYCFNIDRLQFQYDKQKFKIN